MPDQKPWYLEQSPVLGSAYLHFRNTVQEKSVLDQKTRELLMLALACVLRCHYCVENHIQGALNAGATKQEITETLLLTAYEGAGTQLAWCKDIYQKYLSEASSG